MRVFCLSYAASSSAAMLVFRDGDGGAETDVFFSVPRHAYTTCPDLARRAAGPRAALRLTAADLGPEEAMDLDACISRGPHWPGAEWGALLPV